MEIRCRLDLLQIYSDFEDLLQDTIQKEGTTFASDHDLILLFYFEQLPSTVPPLLFPGCPYRNLELKVVKQKNATFYWLDIIYFSIINTSSKEEKLPNLNNQRRANIIPLREILFLLLFFIKLDWRIKQSLLHVTLQTGEWIWIIPCLRVRRKRMAFTNPFVKRSAIDLHF